MTALEIIAEEAAGYGETVENVRGPRRYSHLVAIRRRVAVRMQSELGLSTTSIGQLLGRDHSTIVYLLRGRKRFTT